MLRGNDAGYDVVVLGGGLTGLTSAYLLSEEGMRVLVLEKEDSLGGMLRSVRIKDYFIEEYYHHIFYYDHHLVSLMDKLGLKGRLHFKDTQTGFFYRGKILKLSTPLDIIGFNVISFSDKVRLTLLLLKIKFMSGESIMRLDNVSARNWITENSSESVYEYFFKPLLEGKYGRNSDVISAAWLVDRIRSRSTRGTRGEKLGYVDGGFYSLVDALASAVKANRGEVLLGADVRGIGLSGGNVDGVNFSVNGVGNGARTRNVVSTIPPKSLAGIIELPQDYLVNLTSLEYQGSICLLLGLRKKISRYYWTNVCYIDTVFRAFIEHTNFQDSKLYDGDNILYLASYPDSSSTLWDTSDDDIFKLYFKDLRMVSDDIDADDVLWWKVFRGKNAGLIYKTGVYSKIPAIKTPVGGLYIGGMFNSYPDRSINMSIKIGRDIAELIFDRKTGVTD